MVYKVKLASLRVKKEFDRLPQNVFARLDKVLLSLVDDPFPRGAKKLMGKRDCYRIRVGDYRLIYEINYGASEIVITRVMHRSDVYKGI